MIRAFVVLSVAAAVLCGCAPTREGAQFASVVQTLGPPKASQARVMILRDKGFGGLIDYGYAVTLDGRPIGEIKTGTFIYADTSPGRHELGVKVFGFPGETRQTFTASATRTYFFNIVVSERAKALQGAQIAGGLVGLGIAAAVTADDKNPGPVDFVAMQEAAARGAIAELRLAGN